MSVELILVLSAVTLFASLVIGLTGMGFGIVAMGFFPLFMPISESNVIVSILAVPVILVNFITIRKHNQLKILLPLLITTLACVPIGVWGLVRLNERVLLIGLGAIILLSLVASQIAFRGGIRKPSVPLAVTAGVLSGTFGGAYSISGPPAALYLTAVLTEKKELKASLLFVFLVQIIFRLILLFARGIGTGTNLKMAAILMVPVVLGYLISIPLFSRIPAVWIRRLTQGMLAVSSVMLIIRAL